MQTTKISLGHGLLGYTSQWSHILKALLENERILERARKEFPDLF